MESHKYPKAIYEGRWIFMGLGMAWLLALILFPLLALPIGLLIIFSCYFFRDPERVVPEDPTLIVSPADGTVTSIEEVDGVEGDLYLTARMRRISIFLSVFDVHVNRSPMEGELIHSEPRGGLYLDARKPESSLLNESRLWIIQGESFTIGVKQITGAIARRIVPWAHVGDHLQKGERFGMIRFGSRTELYLPLDLEIHVVIGSKVYGGSTVMATSKRPE
ncbi:MAG: phosphatidylserine decarboxylase [Verrucomicrobia bacterium]|nr:MAG: phosphatidylserine decarboxylase [Verrucomicrobiota bacterium]